MDITENTCIKVTGLAIGGNTDFVIVLATHDTKHLAEMRSIVDDSITQWNHGDLNIHNSYSRLADYVLDRVRVQGIDASLYMIA